MSRLIPALFSLSLLAFAQPVMAEEVVGKVGYMSGSLVAQRTDGTVKVIGSKADVFEGDMLITAKESYAQVLMNDGSRMTLRPESNLKIEIYQFNKESPQKDNAVFRLLKGGFRTVTGFIGKRGNPDAYQLKAAAATIGIRGTDYSARLCEGDECRSAQHASRQDTSEERPVGRVMLLQGSMTARNFLGRDRKMSLGAPVYERDKLSTEAGAYAVVAFIDGSRITIQASSLFYVEKFKYNTVEKQESAVLRLLKGSVRVVTGLIGRVKHDDYRFGIAGATIGVRGTGFDAWCNGACAAGGDPGTTQDQPLEGAGVYVWAGAVVFVTPNGSFDVALSQAAIIARETGKPVPLFVIPKPITENGAPRPDSINVDMNKEFGAGEGDGGAGLYVRVHDGQIIVSQNGVSLNLGSGENGFANGSALLRLSGTPYFMNSPDSGSLDKINPNPSINPAGCVIGQ